VTAQERAEVDAVRGGRENTGQTPAVRRMGMT
jgi:hypothetical protein